MVVVGSRGSAKRRRWASRRWGNGCRRRSMSSSTPAMRCCDGRVVDARRLARGSRRPPGWPPIRRPRRPGPRLTARVRIATSWSFCLAKAIQPFSSASSDGSLSRSIGQCSSEQDGRDHDPLGAEPGRRLFQQPQRPLQVGPPHVAAVDHAQREHHSLRRQVQGAVELLGGADQIEMHRRHRQLQRGRQVVAQVAEIGRQANPNLVRRRAQAARRPTPARATPPWADRGPAPARRPAPSRPRRGPAARALLRRRAAACPAARAA